MNELLRPDDIFHFGRKMQKCVLKEIFKITKSPDKMITKVKFLLNVKTTIHTVKILNIIMQNSEGLKHAIHEGASSPIKQNEYKSNVCRRKHTLGLRHTSIHNVHCFVIFI